jgi:pyridoxine 4-dehydrogenase
MSATGSSPTSPVAAGASPRQIVTAWLLAHSPAMLPIPGTGSVKHLGENVAAAADVALCDDEVEAIDGLARSG